jgi:hypothetical protein
MIRSFIAFLILQNITILLTQKMKFMSRIFCILFALNSFCNLACFSQYVERHVYRIPSTPPWNLGYEVQNATCFTKLSDGGFCLGGRLEYWDQTGIQNDQYGRHFTMKIDSSFILQWVDSGSFYQDWPTNKMRSIIESNANIISGYDSTNINLTFSYLHSDSLNGHNAWSKVVQTGDNSFLISILNMLKSNDSIYLAGYSYDTLLMDIKPVLVIINSLGDTIAVKDYSNYLINSNIEIQKDWQNNFYIILQNTNTNLILHIDHIGNAVSVDTLTFSTSLPILRILTPSKVIYVENNNHSVYKIISNSGVLIDSIFVGSYIDDIYIEANGSILASCQSSQISIFGEGNFIFKIDTLGTIEWCIRTDSSSISTVREINSKFYASGTSGNSVDFLELTPPIVPPQIFATSSVICPDDSVMLSATSGSSYSWSTGEKTQNIYVKEAGDYRVFVVDSAGGGMYSNYQTISLDLNQLFLGNDTLLCNNSVLNLDAGSNFTSYFWQDGSSTQTYLVTSIGIDTLNFFCSVIDTNQCSLSDTMQIIFDLCQTIGPQISVNNFSIYPNPVNSYCYIDSDSRERIKYVVLDLIGQEIMSGCFTSPVALDFSNISSGVYFYFT